MMSEFNNAIESGGGNLVEKEAMPAEFGLAMATFLVVASMVGAGILTTSGYAVAGVGSNQWMLFLWVVGGITAVCGALTLAELSAALPRTGGDYVYLYEAYGPLPAFLSGWVSFLIGFAGPSAVSARASADYLLKPFPSVATPSGLWERVLGSVAILIFAAIHVSGRRRTARVQGWITVVELIALGTFAVAGLVAGWPNTANLTDRTPIDGPLAVSMLVSLVYIYYAYVGWNAASYLAGEIREPQRLLPRAILLGTGGVMLLYLAVNVVYALALSAADVRAIVADPSNRIGPAAVAPIAELAASRLFGLRWSAPLSLAAGVMLLSSLSAYLLIGPRVLFAMARAGQFPGIAARLTRTASTPAVATVFQVGIALLLLWIGSLHSIIEYAGIGLSLFSMLAMSSIYVLRWKRPDLPRPFRTPGYPVTPAIYLILTGLMTLAVCCRRPEVSAYGVLSILAGVPVFYLWQLGSRR
jgi:APA family basic amino acid/polyamine antiporter